MSGENTRKTAPGHKLRRSKLIGDLSEESLMVLESLAKRVTHPAGSSLFTHGDPGDALYIVESGSVEICMYSEGGKKLSLNVMRPPDVFGEIAALDGGARTANATILEPATLLKFKRSHIVSAIRAHPETAVDLIEILCQRLRWVTQQVEDLAMLDIESRLANRLAILHRKFADPKGVLHLSQQEIADFLGATRESINKILQRWRTEGIVTLTRGSIRVAQPERLEAIANLS